MKLLRYICVIFLMSILGIFGLLGCNGSQLEHYKQFMYPIQGQIVGSSDIKFYFLDESKTSEMSNIENIKEIYIKTDTGKKKKAENWILEEDQLDISETYTKRILTIDLPEENEEFIVTQLSVVYLDKTETFDAGNLRVISEANMPKKIMTCDYVNISHLYKKGSLETDLGNFLEILGLNLKHKEGSITITQIDLGIEGVGIEPATICLLDGEKSYDLLAINKSEFVLEEENEVYVQSPLVDELPEQTCEVKITGNSFAMYMAVKVIDTYEKKLNCFYITPIFHGINITGDTFIYGSSKYREVCEPILQDEDEICQILKKNGI